MAQLVKDYNFGFPLKNVQQLDAIEQNILTDDKYATSLVRSQYKFHFTIFMTFSNQNYPNMSRILTNQKQLEKSNLTQRRRQRRKRNISRFCLHVFEQINFNIIFILCFFHFYMNCDTHEYTQILKKFLIENGFVVKI